MSDNVIDYHTTLIANNIYALGSPCVNKLITSVTYYNGKCVVCQNIHLHELLTLTKHDKFHLMIPDVLDINRTPAYTRDKLSAISPLEFYNLPDNSYKHALASNWIQNNDDYSIYPFGSNIEVCTKCVVAIYEIIPMLAYEYAHKYFLLQLLDLHTDIIPTIAGIIIKMLSTPSIWELHGRERLTYNFKK